MVLFAEGDRLAGEYFFCKCSGVVTKRRMHSINPNVIEYTILLDEPIYVQGVDERHEVRYSMDARLNGPVSGSVGSFLREK